MQEIEKRGQDTFKIRQHIVVPEPQDVKIIRSEPTIAPRITRRLHVLPAIDLDHHARAITDEIGNEWSNGRLPPKLKV